MFRKFASQGAKIACALALVASLQAESVQDQYQRELARADRSDVDSVYQLAKWAEENGLRNIARKHYKEALKLDDDHEPTRTAMGFVFMGRRKGWVHESRLPKDQRPGAGAPKNGGGAGKENEEAMVVSQGPGPAAKDVEWNLQLPTDPIPDAPFSQFLDKTISDMNKVRDNYSSNMEIGYRTLLKDEYFLSSIAKLAKAMKDGAYTDLYGPSMMMQEVMHKGTPQQVAAVKKLMPFMAKASEKATDPVDLYNFAYVSGIVGDKRAVARLLELMDNPDEEVQYGARAGLGMICMIPEKDVTKDRVKKWWDKYWGVPDTQVYAASLKDRDPLVRLAASKKLYHHQDRRIVPVLIDLIEDDNRQAHQGAALQLKIITGSDWSYSRNADKEKREKIAETLRGWWEEEGRRFTFVEFRNPDPAAVIDTGPTQLQAIDQWIAELGDKDQGVANGAASSLKGLKVDAFEPLIERGLDHTNPIIRGRARDILREMTGENFGYDAYRGTDEQRQAAQTKWRNWLNEAYPVVEEGAEDS